MQIYRNIRDFTLAFRSLNKVYFLHLLILKINQLDRWKCRKSAFIHLPQSQNNCIDCKTCFAVWGSGWELRTQLGLSKSIKMTISFLPPLPHTSLLIRGEYFKYLVLRTIPQYSVLLSHGSVTARKNSLHHHLPSSTTPEKK